MRSKKVVRCRKPGCEVEVQGGIYCDLHRKAAKKKLPDPDVKCSEPVTVLEDPTVGIPKLTDVQSLTIVNLELKRDAARKSITMVDLELRELDRNYQEIRQGKLRDKIQHEQTRDTVQREYEEYIKHIAHLHGLDPTKMTYDTDTGILRDLREKTSVSSQPHLN